ncbi:MAG: DNA polymerase III subunit alpha [Mycoplasmatales bacterium]
MYINNKTSYSLLKSTMSVSDIVDFALSNNLPAIGICDNNTLKGMYPFIAECKRKNIRPIVAVDTTIAYNNKIFNVLLILKNNKSIYEINKALTMQTYHKYQSLENLSNTIVIFKEPIEINQDNVYFGIKSNNSLSTSLSDKHILIDESVMSTKQDIRFLRLLEAIKQSKLVTSINVDINNSEYLKLYDLDIAEYQKLYYNYRNLASKLEEITFDLSFKIPDYKEKDELFLTTLANKGIRVRLNNSITPDYQMRLNQELGVINYKGFENYFLIMWDLVKYLKQENILYGPGRGSAAGSLVAYALGITKIDPLKNGLLFERFLNESRNDLPDIDLDVEDKHRDKVIEYLLSKYNNTNVIKLGTLSTYQAKSAFKDVAKAFNISERTISKITKLLNANISFKQNIVQNKELAKEFNNTKLEELIVYVDKIEHMPKATSIHASGVIITNEEVYNYTSMDKDNVSDIDASTLEKLGLVKFDILALSTLTYIHDVQENIQNNLDMVILLDNIDMKNPTVYEQLSNGLTHSIFQLESKGMTNLIKKYQPRNFEDLAVLLALYRPGPLNHIDEYIKRKNTNNFELIHPDLSNILSSTYGIIVYQEQVMLISQKLAGYTLKEADVFRRIISKKDEKQIANEMSKFKSKAIQNGYNSDIVSKVSNDIQRFANYGFNKSHAYAYAQIVYTQMFLKVMYPGEYYYYLFSKSKTSSSLASILFELNSLNMNVLPPSFKNLSYEPKTRDHQFILGFNSINLLNKDIYDAIASYISGNPNTDIITLINNVILPLKLNNEQISNLVFSGFFADSSYNEKTLIQYIKSKSNADPVALKYIKVNNEVKNLDNYKEEILEDYEAHSINFNIRYNIFEQKYRVLKQQYPNLLLIQDVQPNTYQDFDIFAKIMNVKVIVTKNNEEMAFIDIKSQDNEYSLRVFPKEYVILKNSLENINNKFAILNITHSGDTYSLIQFVII